MSESKTPPAEAPPELATLLYKGVKSSEDGKLYHEYLHVHDLEMVNAHYVTAKITDAPSWAFGKKLCAGQPGVVFTIHKTPGKDGSVKMTTDKWIGLWADEQRRAAWQAESSAVQDAHEEARDLQRLVKGRADKTALDPFRSAYWKLDARGRRHLLAEVIRYITGGKE